jgi:hypothetical protein
MFGGAGQGGWPVISLRIFKSVLQLALSSREFGGADLMDFEISVPFQPLAIDSGPSRLAFRGRRGSARAQDSENLLEFQATLHRPVSSCQYSSANPKSLRPDYPDSLALYSAFVGHGDCRPLDHFKYVAWSLENGDGGKAFFV